MKINNNIIEGPMKPIIDLKGVFNFISPHNQKNFDQKPLFFVTRGA